MYFLAAGLLLINGTGNVFTASALADDERGKENWDGTIEFSAAAATGNTENTVLGMKFDARRVMGRYTHDVKSGANYAEATVEDSNGDDIEKVTQDNWFLQYRLEVHTGDRTFVYGRTKYEQDEFSGFESRAFLGAGIGHAFIESEKANWNILAGPGIQYTMLETPDAPIPPDFEETQTKFAFYAGSDLNWTLRENVELEHDLDVTYSEDNTTLGTEASIKTKLTETISSRLSYGVTHETDPPEGKEPTDTLLRASVVFGF